MFHSGISYTNSQDQKKMAQIVTNYWPSFKTIIASFPEIKSIDKFRD